ncbi:uncharacterized protein B0T15DRAFT_388957 [Chaetomium strumarium]|uniref:Ubiquinol-cytochrome-c reductase cytochrome c1 n=1 Tax=Chaetomium strumarium TaxID=1170767 RepID=A0AAJ0H4K0_9PEZI|nr:hypothetical protein B0T15DRAFT_388957 [Chaetomium strumarium]
MGNKNRPDERVVYLTLRKVFKGPNARVRRPSLIRKLIIGHQDHEDIAALISAHNIDTLCNITRELLTEQIFEATLKAKIRFPEVFDVSPAQSADRDASDAEAARNDAKAIEDAAQGRQGVASDITQIEADTADIFRAIAPYPVAIPVYLPFRTQHRLLVKVQAIMEQACFEFGQHTMPDVLRKRRWDCPESCELNLWAAEFLARQSMFSGKGPGIGKLVAGLFRSVADIRHTAVHRLRHRARGIEQFLLDAESLVILLKNDGGLKLIRKLRRDTQLAIEELERNKHVLISKFEETLKRIDAQRAELDRLEQVAMANMVKEDGEYRTFTGTNLEQDIECLEVEQYDIGQVF